MAIEQVAFAIATISIGFGVLASLKGLPARLALAALAVFVLLSGRRFLAKAGIKRALLLAYFLATSTEQSAAVKRLKKKKKSPYPEINAGLEGHMKGAGDLWGSVILKHRGEPHEQKAAIGVPMASIFWFA